MITAQELRIGNSLNLFLGIGDNGAEYREVIITGVKSDRDERIRIDSSDHWHPTENFEPIPLTEDWLIRFGFEKTGNVNEEYKLNDYRICNTVHKGYCWVDSDIEFVKTEFVHQLQNLYYSLTGEELKLIK